MMLHEYPLPLAADESSIDWMFVADTLNFSFWGQDEGQHYAVELHGKQYTGYMALCAALTRAVEVSLFLSARLFASINLIDSQKLTHQPKIPGRHTHNFPQILRQHNRKGRQGNIRIKLEQRNPPDRAPGQEPPRIRENP